MALHYGYCDFAQYDGVGRAKASLSSGILRLSFPKYPASPNFVIPEVAGEAKLRHSARSRGMRNDEVWVRRVLGESQAKDARGQRRLCPTNTVILREVAVSIVESATSRSMTVLAGQRRLCPLASFACHSRISAEPKLRHSARSRGIHLCLPTQQPEKPAALALHYGYCDFAQYDGVGRAKASLSSGILRLSFPKYPANPNFVIPRAVAECGMTKFGFCAYSGMAGEGCQRTETPLPCQHRHTARSRSIHSGVCDFAQYDGVGGAKASLSSGILRLSFPKYPQNPNFVIPLAILRLSFPKYPANPNFVIPRAVAESIFACQRSSRRSQRPWHSTMDTATSRSMTVLAGQRRLCPLASFACHSRSTRRTQTPSFPK